MNSVDVVSMLRLGVTASRGATGGVHRDNGLFKVLVEWKCFYLEGKTHPFFFFKQ